MNEPVAVSATGHLCPDPLTQIVTVDQLAARLGVGASAIREHLRAGTATDWLPRPAGRIGRSHVWRTADLEGIEVNRRPPGPHAPRTTPRAPSVGYSSSFLDPAELDESSDKPLP